MQEQHPFDIEENFKVAMESSGELLPRHLLAEEESCGSEEEESSKSEEEKQEKGGHLASMEDLTQTV